MHHLSILDRLTTPLDSDLRCARCGCATDPSAVTCAACGVHLASAAPTSAGALGDRRYQPAPAPVAQYDIALGANGDTGLAAMFWVSFHGLSVFIHTVLITLSVAGPMMLAIVPIPFLAAMCTEVKVVERPIERVEMAIVEIPDPETPPPPEPPPAPVEEIVKATGAIKVAKLKKRVARDEVVEFGMIALLSSTSNDTAVFGALSSIRDGDNVLGGLYGAEIGDSFGAGGLGLSGVGEAGGGRGEGIGLGSIGTIGGIERRVVGGVVGGTGSGYGVGGGGLGKRDTKRVRVALDELAQSERSRLERMLTMCNLSETINGTVVVVDDAPAKVTLDPVNACAARMLKRTSFDADGTFAVAISPVSP